MMTMNPVNPIHEANMLSVAVAAGYVDNGGPLPGPIQDMIRFTVSKCQDVLEDRFTLNQEPESVLEAAFEIGAEQKSPEVENLIRSLVVAAGYRDDCGPLPEQYSRLVLLTVDRCLEVVKNRHAPNQEPDEAVESAFGYVSRLASVGAGICYRAILKGADQITTKDRFDAENRFVDAIGRLLGAPDDVFDAYDAWTEAPGSEGGKRWLTAAAKAMRETLATVGGVEGANFEMEFINDV